jgi:hypothetical protein
MRGVKKNCRSNLYNSVKLPYVADHVAANFLLGEFIYVADIGSNEVF